MVYGWTQDKELEKQEMVQKQSLLAVKYPGILIGSQVHLHQEPPDAELRQINIAGLWLLGVHLRMRSGAKESRTALVACRRCQEP